jgi:branched-chain amino acid aminotransferase
MDDHPFTPTSAHPSSASSQRPETVWFNGRLVAAAEAVVPIAAHGVLCGDGVFETLRVYAGEPFRLDRHLARLVESAALVGLELSASPDVLAAAVANLLHERALSEAVVRITVLRGIGPPGPDPTDCGEALVFITARPYDGYPERIYTEGARAIVASTRQNEHSPLCRVKSTSCQNHVLARAEARRAGVDEALLLNSRGEIAEGSVSNVFVCQGNRLLTPPLSSGCLPGVARAEVLELASGLGFQAEEAVFTADAVLAADEALLTNSLLEVAPLVQLDGRDVGGGVPGEAAHALRAAYLRCIERG